MKSFKQWIIEASMDLPTALSIFGLSQPSKSAEELKSLYKKLAMSCHPDHGGSTQKMQELNAAKEILGKYVGITGGTAKSRRSASDDERIRKMKEYEKIVIEAVKKFFKSFSKEAYQKYFEGIFKKPFTVEVETGSVRSAFFTTEETPYLQMTAYTEGHADVFNLKMTVNVRSAAWDMVNSKALSAKNIMFDYYVSTDALTGGKKQVVVKELALKKSDASILTQPEIVFPKARMAKLASGQVRKGSKLQKRDFESVFKNKWSGEKMSNGEWMIPFDKGDLAKAICIGRYTLYRKGVYRVEGFYERKMTMFDAWHRITGIKVDCKFMPEGQEVMDFFEALFAYAKQNSDIKKIAEYVKKHSAEVADKAS